MAEENHSGLAEKLDEDLNNFLSQLKPRKSKDGWPEDKWEEEMEKHPLFMSKPVNENQELPPLVEALQQLKFNPELNTPEELAQSYKDEGNEYFKVKKYRWAVDCYTEGLKANCKDDVLNAILYANRASAHFYLGNFEKTSKDAVEAVHRKPDYVRAIKTVALCSLKLKKYGDCISWCEKGLEVEKNDARLVESFLEMKRDAEVSKKAADRDRRKALAQVSRQKKEWENVKSIIKNRGISFEDKDAVEFSDWGPPNPVLSECKIRLDKNGDLIWPVLLLYPEHHVTDYIMDFYEDSCFKDHLEVMFSSDNKPDWDLDRKYELENLKVYYADENELIEVNINRNLKSILNEKTFTASRLLSFFITVRNTPFDNYFKSRGLKTS